MPDKSNADLWQPARWDEDETRQAPGYSFWYQVLRTFLKDKLAVLGVIVMCIVTLAAVIGPLFATHTYEEMKLELGNIPPILGLYQISDDGFLYLHPDYYFIRVTADGHIVERIRETENDTQNRRKTFEVDGHIVEVDYGFVARAKAAGTVATRKYAVYLDGQEIFVSKQVWNKTYRFGSDSLGRDLYARTLSGARISLLIAACSTLLNTFIGVLYGGIAGYRGGHTDNIMMRVVDILSTLPVTLIVIMLMVVIGPGVQTIIIAMGVSNWCTMARIVRSHVLSLKEREFVLAAIAANASNMRILVRYLVPNIAASIVVCMTMLVPGAIFNESFLSFIGLGVTTPNASWGTLVNDGLNGFRSFPYQVLIPSAAICMTILALNLIGNALQSAVSQCEER